MGIVLTELSDRRTHDYVRARNRNLNHPNTVQKVSSFKSDGSPKNPRINNKFYHAYMYNRHRSNFDTSFANMCKVFR